MDARRSDYSRSSQPDRPASSQLNRVRRPRSMSFRPRKRVFHRLSTGVYRPSPRRRLHPVARYRRNLQRPARHHSSSIRHNRFSSRRHSSISNRRLNNQFNSSRSSNNRPPPSRLSRNRFGSGQSSSLRLNRSGRHPRAPILKRHNPRRVRHNRALRPRCKRSRVPKHNKADLRVDRLLLPRPQNPLPRRNLARRPLKLLASRRNRDPSFAPRFYDPRS